MIYVQGIFSGIEISPDGRARQSHSIVLSNGDRQVILEVDEVHARSVQSLLNMTGFPGPQEKEPPSDEPAPFEERVFQPQIPPDVPPEATMFGGDDFDNPPEFRYEEGDPGEFQHPLSVDGAPRTRSDDEGVPQL